MNDQVSRGATDCILDLKVEAKFALFMKKPFLNYLHSLISLGIDLNYLHASREQTFEFTPYSVQSEIVATSARHRTSKWKI